MSDYDNGLPPGPPRRSWPAWLTSVLALLLGMALMAGAFLLLGLGASREQAALATTPTGRRAATATPRPSATPAGTPAATPSTTPVPTRTPTATPTPTPTPIVVITGLKALGRLEAAQFTMQTVVDLEKEPEDFWQRLAGPDQLMLMAEGEAVAGFDLARVRDEDVIVNGRAVTLTLPAPEILYSRIDNERTYVYERRTGLLRRPDSDLEGRARLLAEQRLRDWALERGILAQANRFGRQFMEGFLRSLGLTEINILVRGE